MERIPPKLLLIFNIDGTLCQRTRVAPTNILNVDPIPYIVMRPNLDELLR